MDINLPISGNSIYGYAFDVSLSLDSSHLIYGYGYGDFNAVYPVLSYFDVFSIDGYEEGYGTEDIEGYAYGWGYERTSHISGGNIEQIMVTATVTDFGVTPNDPSGIPVLFTGSPGVTFSKNLEYTDSNGQASVYVSVDVSVQRNIDIFGSSQTGGENPRYRSYPSFGYMKIEATIPKCLVARDWDVVLSTDGNNIITDEASEIIYLPSYGYGQF